MSQRQITLALSIFVILQSLLIFAPLSILGAAIQWPDSLDFPASQVLPLVRDNLDQVRLGYGVYLLYSFMWLVLGAGGAWLACRKDGGNTVLLSLAAGLGCASALARCTGIIRWLTASTEYALVYPVSNDIAATRAIEVSQMAVNAWGGAIGEVLGVALFASAWLVVVSIIIVSNKSLPRILGFAGFAVAIIVALPAAELFGYELISITLASSAMHFWLLALGLIGVVQSIGRG